MGGSSLTIEKVVQTVRERGPLANREICAALGIHGEQAGTLDRLLQKARKSGLLRCSGGRWVSAAVETDAAQIARLTAECEEWSRSHGLLAAERDAAIADRDAMQSALDAAMVEHSTLEAERARLAKENDGLREAVAEFEATDAEVREFIEKCKAAQGLAFCAFCGEVTPRDAIAHHISGCVKHPMREVERDRDSLRAQLAALTAEHESAARAAEERIGRLASAMEAAALHVGHRVSCGVHADPMAACDCGYGAVWERYAAVLKEVKP